MVRRQSYLILGTNSSATNWQMFKCWLFWKVMLYWYCYKRDVLLHIINSFFLKFTLKIKFFLLHFKMVFTLKITLAYLLGDFIKTHTSTKKISASLYPHGSVVSWMVLLLRENSLIKTTRSDLPYARFVQLRIACHVKSSNDYQSYVAHLESAIPINYKVFWNHVKWLHGTSSSSKRTDIGLHCWENLKKMA